MTTIDDIYASSEWLKAADLPDDQDLIVTVTQWEISELEKESKHGPGTYMANQIVLHFAEEDKKLGLNKTNGYAIAGFLNEKNPANWVGAQLQLFRTKVPMEARMVDAIRVRAAKYVSTQPQAAMGPNVPSGGEPMRPEDYPPEDNRSAPF